MNIKLHVIKILEEFDAGKYSTINLNEYFHENIISQAEKGFVTEVYYGVLRNRIFINYTIDLYAQKIKKKWLKYLLELSVYQMLYMESDNAGVVWEAVELTKKKYGDVMSKFVNGVLRKVQSEKDKVRASLESENKFALLLSYPNWFEGVLEDLYKENKLDAMKSYKQEGRLSIRVNKLKWTESNLEMFLEKNGVKILKKVESVYYIDNGKVLNTQEFKEGKFIVQDAASYLAAKILAPVKGETVLDCCSAPGGKSLAMAELMNNEGVIDALDIYQHKLDLINNNAGKMKVSIIKTQLQDATNLKSLNDNYDKILADVPCSGFGVLRKKPEILNNKDIGSIKEIVFTQRKILASAASKLKIGGSLVYSTCTIIREENTGNIEWFLDKNKNFEVEAIELPSNVSYSKDNLGGVLIDYKEEYLDGFYIIKMKRVM